MEMRDMQHCTQQQALVRVLKPTCVPSYQAAHVPMSRCAIAPMRRCVNVAVSLCANMPSCTSCAAKCACLPGD
eukprot:1146478-Pelagomonas_calceolata.AAC.6